MESQQKEAVPMKCFAILLVLLLLLTGCAVAPAQESTTPSTTLPAQTEPSTAPGTAPAASGDLPTALPWSVPEAEPLPMRIILHRSGPSTGLTALIPILRWNRRANGSTSPSAPPAPAS